MDSGILHLTYSPFSFSFPILFSFIFILLTNSAGDIGLYISKRAGNCTSGDSFSTKQSIDNGPQASKYPVQLPYFSALKFSCLPMKQITIYNFHPSPYSAKFRSIYISTEIDQRRFTFYGFHLLLVQSSFSNIIILIKTRKIESLKKD